MDIEKHIPKEPCFKCGGKVFVSISSANRSGEIPDFDASCRKCGVLIDYLGENGRLSNALRCYDAWALVQETNE